METPITAKTIYSQLRSNYMLGIVLLGIVALGCGGGGIYFGMSLGWSNLITIIMLLIAAVCLFFTIVCIVKAARVKQHPAFIRYGSAGMIADRINAGLQQPRYTAHAVDGSHKLVTLIGQDFIVSCLDYVSFTEIADIRRIQATYMPETFIVAVGNPLATAASLAMQHAGDRYWESKGLNENTRFDYLIVTNSTGKTVRFGVHHQDVAQVLTMLYQANPNMQIDTTAYRM